MTNAQYLKIYHKQKRKAFFTQKNRSFAGTNPFMFSFGLFYVQFFFMKKTIFTFLLLLSYALQPLVAQIYLNEASNANATILIDQDGDDPDWIELYNGGTSPVNLFGYGLSDDRNNLLKWTFPMQVMPTNAYLTVFASGKNIVPIIDHYETAVYPDFQWKYLLPNASTSAGWKQAWFNVSTWASGKMSIGYGDGDDSTLVPNPTTSIYTRTKFVISDTSKIARAIFDADYDDGFVAYLNGIEIARSGLAGYPPSWDELSSDHEAQMYQGGNPETFIVDDIVLKQAMRNDTNILAIEIHNLSTNSADLTMIPFLTFGFKDANTYYNGAVHQWFNVNLSSAMHTNFTIKATGEKIFLSSPAGILLDSMDVPDLGPDMSFGKQNDGMPALFYFTTPTPNATNNNVQGYTGYEIQPTIAPSGGFYPNAISATIINNSSTGGVVHYTLDGQTPDATSPIYTTPISILQTQVLKARCLPALTNLLPSIIPTETYFIMDTFTLPIVSITTDNANLYGGTGIFDNWSTDWRKPCAIEYFDANGVKQFDATASIKPDGGAGGSRSNPQHSVTIEPANKSYGSGPIYYPLIPEKAFINEYHAFYLRNGSNMWNVYPQKDAGYMRMMRETNVNSQAYSPVIVYVNGEYFGVYELREKANSAYFKNNYGNDADSVDLLSVSYFYGAGVLRVVEGSDTGFYAMKNYVATQPSSSATYFQDCHKKIDLYNFADYIAGENWFANADWVYNNMKIARTRTAGNKWRFFLQDMELGLGYWTDYNQNNFDYFRNNNQPNPYWQIYDALVQNTEFHDYFINRYADLMNTTLQSSKYTPTLTAMYNQLVPEMPRQFGRWTDTLSNPVANQMQDFANYLVFQLDQCDHRNDVVRTQIVNEFSLVKQVDVTLDVQPAGAGYIKISTIVPDTYPWTGVYFDGVPVKMTAVPNPGYSFVAWQPNGVIPTANLTNASIINNIDINETFVATFTGNALPTSLTISEINYNCDSTINGGNWVELHNYGTTPLAIGDWMIRSKTFWEKYIFPTNTVIPANGYLVVCEDTTKFKQLYPTVSNYIGSTGFGWGNKLDSIKIYNAFNQLTVLAVYTDSLPYPDCADGWGRTLELTANTASLLNPASWFCGCMRGSPGVAYTPCNDPLYFTEINYNNTNITYDAGDWVEIKNNSTQSVNLSNYVFRDSKNGHTYTLPNITIPASGYWVLCSDDTKFTTQHPTVTNKSGSFVFNMNGLGDALRLYDNTGVLQYSMLYKTYLPWTNLPATANYTLEYVDTLGYLSPNVGTSWFAGCEGGSPGVAYFDCNSVGFENAFIQHLQAYPNPTSGELMLTFSHTNTGNQVCNISLKDITGRNIANLFEGKLHQETERFHFDISNYAAGVYFLSIQNGESQTTIKVVKW